MFASMDLSNGWTITSRADQIGLSEDELARVLEPRARVFVSLAEIEAENRFHETMLAMAKALLEAPCGELKC